MTLRSRLFKGDAVLEECLVKDSAHVVPGASGKHVAKIQQALHLLEGAAIDGGELSANKYGASKARAVLTYKQKRKIINLSYQTQADNIVGKMTIRAVPRCARGRRAGRT